MTNHTTEHDENETSGHDPTDGSRTAAGSVDPNRVALLATVTTPPERRVLPSGDEVVSFGVSVPRDEGGSDAIPIQVGPAPPSGRRPTSGQAGRRLLARADRLQTGDRIAVVGRLRRRWWDAGGARRSRIEVSATTIEVMTEPPS